MAAPSGYSSSALPLPPPRPKSPPQYPDLYGKRREMAKVQMLEREIGFLEEELKSVQSLQPASRCCKEVTDYVVANSDPFIATNRKNRRRCRFWKWLCRMPCFNLSWICCCCCCCYNGCSIHLEMPRCCRDCNPCNSCSCASCCCCKCNRCNCGSCLQCGSCNCNTCNCGSCVPSASCDCNTCKCASCDCNTCKCTSCDCNTCKCVSCFSCHLPKWRCCAFPRSNCCKTDSCIRNCCNFPSPSCPDCSCCIWRCSRPKCPKVSRCCCCTKTCCNPCYLCY